MAERAIPKIETEYAFSIRMFFKERVTFTGPHGGRGYVPPASGEIFGPRLQGIVVPYSGADYARFKDVSQGIQINTHYMLKADDGAWIYIRNIGYLHHHDPKVTYFRMTPYFDAPKGPHEWLTRTIILGTGQRLSNPDRSLFTYYAVK